MDTQDDNPIVMAHDYRVEQFDRIEKAMIALGIPENTRNTLQGWIQEAEFMNRK